MKFESMMSGDHSSNRSGDQLESDPRQKKGLAEIPKAIALGAALLAAGEIPEAVACNMGRPRITPVEAASREVREAIRAVQVREVGDTSPDADRKSRKIVVQWSRDLGDTFVVYSHSFSCPGVSEVDVPGGTVEISGFGVDTFFQIYKKGTFSDEMTPAKDMRVEGAITLQVTQKNDGASFLVFPDGKEIPVATSLWGEYGALAPERTAKMLHDGPR